ncbi:MAG: hypothetical protein IKS39_08350 [Clostridia bacterium]|jgi:hypothetical protein|nr:hypothetical protein [Clostridia bacterium]
MMNERIRQFEYYLLFESGEKSENFEWDEELSPDELDAYNEFREFSLSLEESPLMGGVLKRVEKKILSGNLEDFVMTDEDYSLFVSIPMQ